MSTNNENRYIQLLEDNNKLFKRIAESLETITLHLLDTATKQAPPALPALTYQVPITHAKNNPMYYLKTTDAAIDLVKRCIVLAKESGDRVVSTRSLAKMIRHEFGIPEEQLLDLSPLQPTYKVCGLTQVSKFMYLIEDNNNE